MRVASLRTAVVALEVQENLLLPEKAMIPGLAAHAHAIGLIDRLATLFQSARRVGVLLVVGGDGPDVCVLGVRGHVPHPHVVEQALTQWGHRTPRNRR